MPDSAKSIENIQQLAQVLQYLGYEIKDPDKLYGSKIIVLLDGSQNRVEELEKIAKLMGGEYAKQVAGSSVGGTIIKTSAAKNNKFVVLAKPKSRQGKGSAGIDNEIFIIKQIQSIIKETGEPIIVEIVDSERRKFEATGVYDCIETGRDTKGRKKADIILRGKKDYSISIKKDNAAAWESADTYWRGKALHIINELQKERKVKLTDLPGRNGVYKIEPELLIDCNKEEIRDFVFGSDLQPNGCVIKRTFSSRDFQYDGKTNTLKIQVTKIIDNMEDVTSGYYMPKILLRNDSSRTSPKGIPGIRILAIYGKRGNVLHVSLSERNRLIENG
jgi:hypothetical protein